MAWLVRIIKRLAVAARLGAAVLCPLLLFPALLPVVAVDRTSDVYLTGFVASILERELLWERDSYRLKVHNGVATITLFQEDPQRREAADQRLRPLDGLQRIAFVVKPTDASRPGVLRRFLRLTSETEALPTGDYFRPLLADPKQPQFFVSLQRFQSSGVGYTMASVGFGETFGLYRFLGSREGNGLQFSLEGAIFAQFDMNTPSSDLVNADYTIGFPITYRLDDHSLRARIYHQSSHLGDELLMSGRAPERVNLSYEAIELIYSHEWSHWRVYGGGEYLFSKEPDDLKSSSSHWGIEYHASKVLFWRGRPMIGVDMKKMEQHDWAIDTSVKAGLEFGHPSPGQRRLRLLAEYYKGLDPHGQFYVNKIESFGLGVSLGF